MTSLLKNIQAGMVSLKTSKVPATLENQVSKTESLGRQEVCDAAATAAMNANVWGQEKTHCYYILSLVKCKILKTAYIALLYLNFYEPTKLDKIQLSEGYGQNLVKFFFAKTLKKFYHLKNTLIKILMNVQSLKSDTSLMLYFCGVFLTLTIIKKSSLHDE
jgi:hypothetical protein